MFLADVHIYENHVKQVEEQLQRKPLLLPKLRINRAKGDVGYGATGALHWLESLEPGDITLEDYEHHPAIKAEMAV